MSAKKFFKKLLRYTLCLAAGLAAFAACGYTDYRLWPLDLPASAHPRVPMTGVANQQLVLPFTPGVPVAEVASFNDSSKRFCALSICAAAKHARDTIPRPCR